MENALTAVLLCFVRRRALSGFKNTARDHWVLRFSARARHLLHAAGASSMQCNTGQMCISDTCHTVPATCSADVTRRLLSGGRRISPFKQPACMNARTPFSLSIAAINRFSFLINFLVGLVS